MNEKYLKIPRTRIHLSNNQIKSLATISKNGNLAIGPQLDILSKALAKKFQRRYCILTANGFTALKMTMHSMGWKNKRIGIPVASTCFSVVNAIKASNNIPVFIDNDLKTTNINIDAAIEAFKKRKIDAIINPNHNGNISDKLKLYENLVPVLEDNAQSALAVTDCIATAETFILSFYVTKDINGIDGGAVLTNDKKVYEFLKNRIGYRNQKYNDDVIRYNYCMQNINAALALESLSELETKKTKLSALRARYDSVINKIKHCRALRSSDGANNLASKYIVIFETKSKAKAFERYMQNSGIEVTKEFLLLTKFKDSEYPNGVYLVDCARSIPFFEDLREPEIKYVLQKLNEYTNEETARNPRSGIKL